MAWDDALGERAATLSRRAPQTRAPPLTGTTADTVRATDLNKDYTTPIRTRAEQLITRRLAACVTLMPVQSCYRWQGKIERAQEVQLLIKTSSQHLEQLLSVLEQLHSYDTPEILQLAADAGAAYAAWALDALSPDDP